MKFVPVSAVYVAGWLGAVIGFVGGVVFVLLIEWVV